MDLIAHQIENTEDEGFKENNTKNNPLIYDLLSFDNKSIKYCYKLLQLVE